MVLGGRSGAIHDGRVERGIMKTHIALILLLIVGVAAPALAGDDGAVTPDDLEAARQRNRALSASLETTDIRYEAAVAEEIQIRERLHGMASRVSETEQRLAVLRLVAESVVRESYMSAGSDGGVTTILGSTSFSDIPVRATYLHAVGDRDIEVIDEMLALEDAYRAQVADLDAALARQRSLVVEIEGLAAQLLADLDVANADYRELKATWQRQEEERKRREDEERRRRAAEEERRRLEAEAARAAAEADDAATTTTRAPETSTPVETTTTVAPSTSTSSTTTTTTVAPTASTVVDAAAPTGAAESDDASPSTTSTTMVPTTTTSTTVPTPAPANRVCPVDGASSFSDTWGAPRSGGRTHKGVDMSASKGTPLVAMEAGGIYRLSNSSLGGISLYLLGNSGDMYYYAHLDAWAEGLAGGGRVAAGDLVGYVGTSGNSPAWVPHLHLGWKPGNGDWANPYPLVNGLCR
jgi:murein DD-endopeptidase MepM/ murein hydrolase activator NlpD